MFKKEIKGGPRMRIRIPNANVVLYGVFDTTVSKDALEKAVLFLSDKHKLLNCYINIEKENKTYYVIDKSVLEELHDSGELVKIQREYGELSSFSRTIHQELDSISSENI